MTNDLLPTALAEDDIWSPARDYVRPSVELGTVGWDGDTDDTYVDFGSANNDGHTLVNVQLYRGRGLTKPKDDHDGTKGLGRQIMCQISGTLFRIPKRGTVVYVAFPGGLEDVPGAGVIFATLEPSPFIQFNKDRAQITFGDDVHVVIRGKSVTMTAPGNQFIMVGTSRGGGNPMLLAQDQTGSGWTVQNGTVGIVAASGGSVASSIQVTPTQVGMMQNAGSFVKLEGGNFVTVATNSFLTSAGVFLGKAPTVANPALWGVTGVSGVASTSVYISPV